MKSIKGTNTEKILLAAFAGESQARNRYTYFASQAKKNGFEQISAIFLDTADNEKEHAKRFFSFLEGGDVEITASYPAGIVGGTDANLKAAAAGENFEHTTLYPGFAKTADSEGFKEVATQFRNIIVAEINHEKRFLKLLSNVQRELVFRRETPVKWRCRNCGYVHEGTGAPEKCSACLHPMAHFELFNEAY